MPEDNPDVENARPMEASRLVFRGAAVLGAMTLLAATVWRVAAMHGNDVRMDATTADILATLDEMKKTQPTRDSFRVDILQAVNPLAVDLAEFKGDVNARLNSLAEQMKTLQNTKSN